MGQNWNIGYAAKDIVFVSASASERPDRDSSNPVGRKKSLGTGREPGQAMQSIVA
jgi:hypothetical protein